MFGKSTIYKAVMAAIKEKIADAQKAFDIKVATLKSHIKDEHEALDVKFELEKNTMEREHVEAIIGKIL